MRRLTHILSSLEGFEQQSLGSLVSEPKHRESFKSHLRTRLVLENLFLQVGLFCLLWLPIFFKGPFDFWAFSCVRATYRRAHPFNLARTLLTYRKLPFADKLWTLENKYNYVGLNPAALINYLSNFSNIFKHQIQTI